MVKCIDCDEIRCLKIQSKKELWRCNVSNETITKKEAFEEIECKYYTE